MTSSPDYVDLTQEEEEGTVCHKRRRDDDDDVSPQKRRLVTHVGQKRRHPSAEDEQQKRRHLVAEQNEAYAAACLADQQRSAEIARRQRREALMQGAWDHVRDGPLRLCIMDGNGHRHVVRVRPEDKVSLLLLCAASLDSTKDGPCGLFRFNREQLLHPECTLVDAGLTRPEVLRIGRSASIVVPCANW